MAAAMTYTVSLEMDDAGWWLATVQGVPGCHTQGRSIHQAMGRAREALSVCVEDAVDADLVADTRLPADARRVVRRYESARRRLECDREAARRAADDAVEKLTGDLGLSVRDAAELLGLSHQRIHQVVHR